MSTLETALERYHVARAAFRWDVPEQFNFGRDVVDHWADGSGRPALFCRAASDIVGRSGSDRVGGDASGCERRLSFDDVARAANRVAHLLRDLGIGPGDPLILMLPRVPEWHIVSVAALEIGALLIPSATLLRPKDIAYRANHSGAVAIVAHGDARAATDAIRDELPGVAHFLELTDKGGAAVSQGAEFSKAADGWLDLLAAAAEQPDDPGAGVTTAASDPALVYYTSGTTGPPKAVLHTHAYTFAQRATTSAWHGVRTGERIWTTSDTGWAKAAYGVLFGPWSVGAEVVLVDGRFDPQTELTLLREIAPAVFCAPPTEFRLLVKQDLSDFSAPALRECVSAGEPLNPEVIRAWEAATGVTIRDGYGQTESILLVGNFPGMPVRPGSMGLPLPGMQVEVVDADGAIVPTDEVGEIAVRAPSPGLFSEYWKDAAATAGSRIDSGESDSADGSVVDGVGHGQSDSVGEWYLTGDRATRDADGYFWFVGRNDDVIISAGYRIGPFEVESALLEHPDVLESAAVAAPDADRGSVVKAFVVLRPGVRGTSELAAELQDHVKRITAPYKYPRIVEFVESLPKTVSGKIRRVELRERSASDSGESD
jgi:acetyl-CoA synthetase/medium-chain acyl-CoA synthetase